MSDLRCKKTAVIQVLSEPGGSDLGNPEIARRVGCDAKLVRTVRQELELEGLRADLADLKAQHEKLKAELAAYLKSHPETLFGSPPIGTASPRPRRSKPAESYPLFGELA